MPSFFCRPKKKKLVRANRCILLGMIDLAYSEAMMKDEFDVE